MLVTEYCEGGSLDRNIKRGKVNWYKRGKKVSGTAGCNGGRAGRLEGRSGSWALCMAGRASLQSMRPLQLVQHSLEVCVRD